MGEQEYKSSDLNSGYISVTRTKNCINAALYWQIKAKLREHDLQFFSLFCSCLILLGPSGMLLYHWGLLLQKVTDLGNLWNEGKAVQSNRLEFFAAKYPKKDGKEGPWVKVGVQQGLLIIAFSLSRSTFAEMGISRGNIRHSLNSGSICTSCGSSLKDLMCMDIVHIMCISLLPSSSVPAAQDVTLLVIRLNGVGFGLWFSHSTPRSWSFFWFYTEFGFMFILSPFSYCQGAPVYFHPCFRGCYFSNLCRVWGIRTSHIHHLKLSLQLFFFFLLFFPFSSAQFSRTMITQLRSCLPFLPLGPVPFYYHSSGTDKQLLGGCLTFYKQFRFPPVCDPWPPLGILPFSSRASHHKFTLLRVQGLDSFHAFVRNQGDHFPPCPLCWFVMH